MILTKKNKTASQSIFHETAISQKGLGYSAKILKTLSENLKILRLTKFEVAVLKNYPIYWPRNITTYTYYSDPSFHVIFT